MIFDMSPDSVKLVATLPDGDRTDRFECLLSVCRNPTCRCRAVYLTFVAQTPKGGRWHGQNASIDLDIKGVESEFRRTNSMEGIAFCERLVTEMDEHDFHLLGNLHFMIKNEATEKAKPDTINPHFDFAKIESSSTMQVYNEILPFGDRLLITIDGIEHILLDQHCVRAGCDCTETCIDILPILADGHLGKNAGTILLDYASRQWKTAPDNDTPCDLAALRQRTENAIPEFYARLLHRHAKLQAIYRHCRKRHLATLRETKITLAKNVGRNDLCPCGSGKKYKKCCMTSATAPAASRTK